MDLDIFKAVSTAALWVTLLYVPVLIGYTVNRYYQRPWQYSPVANFFTGLWMLCAFALLVVFPTVFIYRIIP